MRRIFLTVVLTLLALAIFTMTTVWFLLRDEAFLKSRIIDFVFDQTGRELAIKGPLRLNLGRETSLEVQDLTFQNADWADRANMVSVGRLLIKIDLPSLFGEAPVIPALVVENCSISLVKNDAGKANWDVLPNPEPDIKQAPAVLSGESLPVLLKNLQIRKCSLKLDTADRDLPLIAEADHLSLQIRQDNRVEGSGAGRIDGEALSFSGWSSSLGAFLLGGPLEYDLNLYLGDISLQSSGVLQDAAALSGANIKTLFHGPEIGRVLDTFSLPPLSKGPFDFRLDLDTEGPMTKLDLDGDLGNLSINASGRLDRLARPQFGKLLLDMKGPDLEALGGAFGVAGLVSEPFSLRGDIAFDQGIITAQSVEMETLEDHLEVSGVLGSEPDFANSSLDVKVSSKETGRWRSVLALPETSPGTLQIDGNLNSDSDGVFSVRARLTSADFTVEATGTLGKFKATLQPDLEITVESTDLQTLGTLAGINKLPAAAASAQGHIRLSGQKIQLKGLNIDLAGHHGVVDGWVNLEDNYTGSTLDISFESPDIGELGRLFGQENFPPLEIIAQGSLQIEKNRTLLETVHLQLDQVKATIDGNIQHDNHFQLAIKASGPDASILEQWTGRTLEPEPFSVDTRLAGSPSEFEFTELDFRLGKSEIRGHLKISPGDLTRISGRLDSPFLDLTQWTEDENHSTEQAAASSSPVFNDTPVMVIADYGVAANLDLIIERASLANTEVHDVRLGLQLNPKYLELKPFSFKGSTGGAIHGTVLLDSSGSKPRFILELNGQDLYLGFAALEGQDPATFPPLDIKLMLEGKGVTLHEMATSFNGETRLHYRSGMFASSGLSPLLTDFATELFNTLNPGRQSNEYTELSCAVLAADFTNGMVNVFPVIIQTSQVTIISQGVVDLLTEDIDFSFNSKTRTGLGLSVGMLINPFIKVGGSLSSPVIELDPANSMVSGGIAVATAGLSLVAKSMSDRFFSSKNPCGDALKLIAEKEERGQVE